MRLRKPCQHGYYDAHFTLTMVDDCPGGEFLPESLGSIDWCVRHGLMGEGPDHCVDGDPDSPRDDWCRMVQALIVPVGVE